MQITRFSITAARGIQLNSVLNRSHAQMPCSSPRCDVNTKTRSRKNRTKALNTLHAEAEQSVNISSFVIAAQQVHVLRMLDLTKEVSEGSEKVLDKSP